MSGPERAHLDELRAAAARHADRIERMFGRKGVDPLRQLPRPHPAVRQVDALRHFARGGAVPYGTELEQLGEIAVMQIDQRMWPTPASADDPWSFLPSDKLRNEMKRRLREPGSFGDTLAELYVWGYLRDKGFSVTLTDKEGEADLAVQHGDAVVHGDVKRVRIGSSPNAAGRAVTKANRQVKRTVGDDRAGVAFIQVERPVERVAIDDRVPADVQAFVEEVRIELAGESNKSIAAAIIFWDDVLIADGNGDAGYFFRRRATVVEHANARSALPLDPDDLKPIAWFGAGIRSRDLSESERASLPEPKPRARGSIVATPVYQQMNDSPDGVRVGHAIDLFANPDRITSMPGDVLLATRYVPAGQFTLLGIASIRDEATQISMAFRLYDAPQDTDPESALLLFLDRYGIPARVGGEVALLHASVPAPADGELVSIDNPPEEGFMHAVARMGDTGPAVLHCVFAFDGAKYWAANRAKSA